MIAVISPLDALPSASVAQASTGGTGEAGPAQTPAGKATARKNSIGPEQRRATLRNQVAMHIPPASHRADIGVKAAPHRGASALAEHPPPSVESRAPDFPLDCRDPLRGIGMRSHCPRPHHEYRTTGRFRRGHARNSQAGPARWTGVPADGGPMVRPAGQADDAPTGADARHGVGLPCRAVSPPGPSRARPSPTDPAP
jgi:hypothetical protein